MLILALTVAVVLCLPLKSLGLSDRVVLNEKTVAEIKLDDTSIAKLLPLAKSLFADNSSLVTNAPTGDDLTATNAKFASSSANQGGKIQYSSLIYKKAIFPDSKQLTFTDRQLAALINQTVKQAPDDLLLSTSAEILNYLGSRAIKDILHFLEVYDVTVEHVKLGSNSSSPTFECLLSLDISQYADGVQLPLFGALQSRVYVKVTYALGVSATGRLQLSDGALSLNGKSSDTSQKVLDALLIAFNNDEDGEPQTSQTFVDGIAAFIQVVFEHVGSVGSGAFSLGMSGVDVANKTLTVITHTSLLDFLF